MNQYKELEHKIVNSYTEGVTIAEAESLAAEFLDAMIKISENLRVEDLDTRMKKSGLKTVKASVYLEEARKGEKKPTESMLSAIVDSSKLVESAQKAFDEAENKKENLERLLSIFKEAHVHFRGISKGKYE